MKFCKSIIRRLNVCDYLVKLLIHKFFYYKLHALKNFYYIIKKVI